jgi:DNA topoisomerase-1
MGHTLIITEKPTAAKTIAEALSDSKPKKYGERNAVWYEFEKDGKRYITVPAVGHLFTLKQKTKGWDYPVFNVEWVPAFKATKRSSFSKPYFENIENLTKDATDFIIATDYDTEGQIIGFNILRFICGKQNAARMKFSTMTKEELRDSFKNMSKTLDKNLTESGLTRHFLDWYWGVNLTRALTLAIKSAAKRFRILSTGRVQGPTLHMLAKHEKRIKAFKPKPFWQIEMEIKVDSKLMKAFYKKDKIWDKKEADGILNKCKTEKAIVEKITKRIITQKPPNPYNTTSLLADIYRYFGYTPQQGMNISESLYQNGLISYPRTSSEKLPPDINYKNIIKNLSKQKLYKKETEFLLKKKELRPKEGKRKDPAHPAIYPTGKQPKRMGSKQKKVYDLIVRRFFAVFGDPAKRESQKIALNVNGEIFYLKGKRTVESGWTALYGKYSQRDEIILPQISVNDVFPVKNVKQLEKETQPPSRYSQGSVLKEMEAKGLGTKATRSGILQILYTRGYLIGKSIEVTELGMSLSDILERNVSPVISEKLTRYFEQKCDEVEAGKVRREEVLEEVKKTLEKIAKEFKKKEKKIGEELTRAVIATQDKQSILGKCPKCSGTLKVHKNWRTGKRFVGCSGYKKGCRVGFPLPREGLIMSTEKTCEQCKTPIIQVRRAGSRPFRMCLDPRCPTKKDWLDEKKLKRVQRESRKRSKEAEKNTCEKCGRSFTSKRGLSLHKRSCKV